MTHTKKANKHFENFIFFLVDPLPLFCFLQLSSFLGALATGGALVAITASRNLANAANSGGRLLVLWILLLLAAAIVASPAEGMLPWVLPMSVCNGHTRRLCRPQAMSLLSVAANS